MKMNIFTQFYRIRLSFDLKIRLELRRSCNGIIGSRYHWQDWCHQFSYRHSGWILNSGSFNPLRDMVRTIRISGTYGQPRQELRSDFWPELP